MSEWNTKYMVAMEHMKRLKPFLLSRLSPEDLDMYNVVVNGLLCKYTGVWPTRNKELEKLSLSELATMVGAPSWEEEEEEALPKKRKSTCRTCGEPGHYAKTCKSTIKDNEE